MPLVPIERLPRVIIAFRGGERRCSSTSSGKDHRREEPSCAAHRLAPLERSQRSLQRALKRYHWPPHPAGLFFDSPADGFRRYVERASYVLTTGPASAGLFFAPGCAITILRARAHLTTVRRNRSLHS
jgi:hypothetical protein